MTFVLVVDDDPAMRSTLDINLRARGFEVECAGDGRSALQIIGEREPDVLLLDLGLPDLDGISVLTQLRSFSSAPVIVVSARSDSSDKVQALDLGADDFVTKPFAIEELLARVRATARRRGLDQENLIITIDGIELNVSDFRARKGDTEIHFTPIEWKIIAVLARSAGKLVRQQELLRKVWGPGFEKQTNYLRVHLASIRRKLEHDPSRPRIIITEPGIGYRFITSGVSDLDT